MNTLSGIAVHDAGQEQKSVMNSNEPYRCGSNKEKQMNALTKATSAAVLVTLGLALAAGAAESPKRQSPDRDRDVQLWATLRAKSDVPTVTQIAPYVEALIVYEWEVTQVEKGRFDGKRLRVAHWVVFDRAVQSPAAWKVGENRKLLLRAFEAEESLKKICLRDTLNTDVDVPFYYDVGQALNPPSAEVMAGRVTEALKGMLPHRLHVKLVAIGDSRVAGGVDTSLFYADEKHPVPVADNLAQGGLGIPDCELGVRVAVRHCPNLEWVVLGLGPRMVAARWPVRRAGDGISFIARKRPPKQEAEPAPETQPSEVRELLWDPAVTYMP